MLAKIVFHDKNKENIPRHIYNICLQIACDRPL